MFATRLTVVLLVTLCAVLGVMGVPMDHVLPQRRARATGAAAAGSSPPLDPTGLTMSFCGLFKNSRKICDHAFGLCKYCTKPGATWPQLCATKNEARHAEKGALATQNREPTSQTW